MIEIERLARRSKTIPLISLIDVVFQLLIYFMLTTSFTRSESLELSLPSASPAKAKASASAASGPETKTLHIYISNDGSILLEQKQLSEQAMAEELHNLLIASPERGVLILSADKVKVQALVHVMDRIYSAGGKNIAVADWNQDGSSPLQGSISQAGHHG